VPCSINGPPTVIEKSEVYIVVSMSHDRIQTDPKKSIRKLATKILDRMQAEVSKICYGKFNCFNWQCFVENIFT